MKNGGGIPQVLEFCRVGSARTTGRSILESLTRPLSARIGSQAGGHTRSRRLNSACWAECGRTERCSRDHQFISLLLAPLSLSVRLVGTTPLPSPRESGCVSTASRAGIGRDLSGLRSRAQRISLDVPVIAWDDDRASCGGLRKLRSGQNETHQAFRERAIEGGR